MEIISRTPYNAHAYSSDLVKSFITPNDLHYVRLHLPVPQIELEYHRISISGIGISKPVVLPLDTIKKDLSKHYINVTLQCSGNRRAEMNQVKLTHGVPYKHTAISTATWDGYWLVDLLHHYKINTLDPGVKYINFEGADEDPSGQAFGASIPVDIAMDPQADIMLAIEMNGKALPPDHGYPIRLIVPGMAGFKSVKFLKKIILSDREVESIWERRMYRFYSSNYYWDNIDYDSAQSLLYTNVQSGILVPNDKERVKVGGDGLLLVKGYAFSGGGNGIRRVDVSIDEGFNWVKANFTQDQRQFRHYWTWVLWKAKIYIPKSSLLNGSKVWLTCRAFDSQYNSQSKDVKIIWNMMGILVNHWHRIGITILVNAKQTW